MKIYWFQDQTVGNVAVKLDFNQKLALVVWIWLECDVFSAKRTSCVKFDFFVGDLNLFGTKKNSLKNFSKVKTYL